MKMSHANNLHQQVVCYEPVKWVKLNTQFFKHDFLVLVLLLRNNRKIDSVYQLDFIPF